MIMIHDDSQHAWHGLGLGVLSDWLETKVHRELNGSYYFEGVYKVDGVNADKLVNGRVLQCNTGQRTKRQFFDIVKITQVDDKRLQVYAEHVSYRLKKMVTNPEFDLKGDGSSALGTLLTQIQGEQPYRSWSDVVKMHATHISIDKFLNAYSVLSEILKVWGGEFEFDNFTIKLHKQLGRTRPTEIIYGKNLASITDEQSEEELYTHIKPFVKRKEGFFLLPGDGLVAFHEGEVYTRPRILAVDFSSHFQEDANIVDVNLEATRDKPSDSGKPKTERGKDVPSDVGTGEGGAFVRYGDKWRWQYTNGKYASDRWIEHRGNWYRIGKNSYAYENEYWRDKNGKQYYFQSGGAMATGWIDIDNRWKYFGEDGVHQSDAKHTYSLDTNKLLQLAKEYVAQNDAFHEKYTTTLSYVDLTAAGEGVKEELELADNVVVRFLNHQLEGVMLKVVATDWDCLAERYHSVTIGQLPSLSSSFHTSSGLSSSAVTTAVKEVLNTWGDIHIEEMKGLIGRTGDGENDVYWADDGDKPIEPKGGFKEGDLWWEKNGKYRRLHKWNGESWELIFDNEDPEKSLLKYKEEAEREAERLKKEIEDRIENSRDAWSENAYKKFLAEIGKPDSEAKRVIEANVGVSDAKLSEALDGKLKDIDTRIEDITGGSIDSLRKKLDATSEIARINTELIGGDGQTSYSKNRLEGETDRTIPFKTDYIEVTHNGDGFVVGQPYTISWEATCVPYGHKDIRLIANVGWFKPGGELRWAPREHVFPTVTQEWSKREMVIPMLYYGVYDVQFVHDWYQTIRQTVTISDSSSNTVTLPLWVKTVADGNALNASEAAWLESPDIIFDGGGYE